MDNIKVDKPELMVKRKDLSNEVELKKEEIKGLLIIDLNSAIAERLKSEVYNRFFNEKLKLYRKNKEKEDSILSSITKNNSLMKDEDETIKVLRQLISEVEDGSFTI